LMTKAALDSCERKPPADLIESRGRSQNPAPS